MQAQFPFNGRKVKNVRLFLNMKERHCRQWQGVRGLLLVTVKKLRVPRALIGKQIRIFSSLERLKYSDY